MDLIALNLDKFFTVGILICTSVYLRILLQSIGQAWITTLAHTATLTLLPIITYVITNVISGNIALSLGMVGALSIVRFRNPVRSPLELSVYFGAITMGIAAAVSLNWLIFLIGSITLVVFILFAIGVFTKALTGRAFFILSFSEGNSLSTLNVVSKKEIKNLETNNNLVSKTLIGTEFSYTLASLSFETLQEIERSVRSKPEIISIQLDR